MADRTPGSLRPPTIEPCPFVFPGGPHRPRAVVSSPIPKATRSLAGAGCWTTGGRRCGRRGQSLLTGSRRAMSGSAGSGSSPNSENDVMGHHNRTRDATFSATNLLIVVFFNKNLIAGLNPFGTAMPLMHCHHKRMRQHDVLYQKSSDLGAIGSFGWGACHGVLCLSILGHASWIPLGCRWR